MDGLIIDDIYIEKILAKVDHYKDDELSLLVEQLLKERAYLLDAASTDSLTGVNNRRILSDIEKYSAIVMIDIDDFKKINDNYGHDIGDNVIKMVADILKNNIRRDDYVCRLGGDEFVIIFTNCPLNVVRERAETILNEVRYTINAVKHDLNVSIGIAINTEEEQISDVLKKADIALYESKRNGKGQIIEFDGDVHSHVRMR